MISIVQSFMITNLKFLLCFIKSLRVSAIDHIDEYVSVVEVVPPVGPDFSLPPNVPHVELEPLALHALDVEALGRCDGRDVLAGQALQDCRLAGVIKTKE